MKLVRWLEMAPQEVAEQGASNTTIRVLLGPEVGATNFTMRLFEIAPGGQTPLHSHDWEHEMFVLAGRGVCVLADGEVPITAGDALFMPGAEKHCFRNTADETLRVICLIPASCKCE